MTTEEMMKAIFKKYNSELLILCGRRKQEGKDCEGCPCIHPETGCVVAIIEEMVQ